MGMGGKQRPPIGCMHRREHRRAHQTRWRAAAAITASHAAHRNGCVRKGDVMDMHVYMQMRMGAATIYVTVK
jgi:hypothetical protein